MVLPESANYRKPPYRLAAGRNALIAAMKPEVCISSPKTVILREGEQQSKLYRIVSGWAARRHTFADGRDRIMSILLPGDIFGVRGLLSNSASDAVEARQMLSLESISYSSVLHLAARNIDVAMWLLWYVNRQNAHYDKWLTLLAQGSALEKVAILLLDLHRRLNPTGRMRERRIRVPLTQRDIADHLGLALPHVCRTLAVLRERGGVSVGYGMINILDPAVLAANAADMADYWQDGLEDLPDESDMPPAMAGLSG